MIVEDDDGEIVHNKREDGSEPDNVTSTKRKERNQKGS